MISTNYDYILKCIIVGDGGVGKTALSIRYTEGKFRDDYKMTIGVDFSTKIMNVDDKSVKFQIWDTGGQEQFSYVRPMYYTGSTCGFVVFDKTNRQSFYNIGKWFKEVYDNAGQIPLILIGNKIDLADHQVSTEEAKTISDRYNTLYFETSAKSGELVNSVFTTLVKMVIDPKYVDMLKSAGIEIQKTQILSNVAYKKYDEAANKSNAFFQAGNKSETLKFLKEALFWAKRAEFEDGIRWCEDQIVYISGLLNVATPVEMESIVLTCTNCNTYFKVHNEGDYLCPKCSSTLVKVPSSSIKV
ncbi:MAG: GTP-binding protein [Candidatus Hodarchaeota archaeon]